MTQAELILNKYPRVSANGVTVWDSMIRADAEKAMKEMRRL